MSASFHSQIWHRVATIKPALKPGVEVSLHDYLGEKWFVLRDPIGGKVHRFTAEAYALVGAMSGRASMEKIWLSALDRLGEDAPSQDDAARLLMRLNQADLLLVDSIPMAKELVERMEKTRRQKRSRYWKNPMAVPVPIFDPDPMLEALAPLVRGRLGWVWLIAWLGIILAGVLALPANWDALTQTSVRDVLAAQNLAVMAIVYPIVKLLHELAHGLALKRYGGESHETGIMFLVFYPVPYIEASASSAFPDKYARAFVAGVGILTELAIAALCLLIWQVAEPGILKDAAFNAMLIAGVSTVVVNGNPLLKFDGYFVLCDLVEIPNLAQRGAQWWGWHARRLLGARSEEERAVNARERVFFLFYPPAHFGYRVFVMLGIAWLVSTQYPTVGIVLAAMSLFQGLVMPVWRTIKPLFEDPQLAEKRPRAAVMFGGVFCLFAALMLFWPAPLRVTVEAVIDVPEEAKVRAATAGLLSEWRVADGTTVSVGQLIAVLVDRELEARVDAAGALVRGAERRAATAQAQDRAAWRVALEELAQAETRLQDLTERLDQLLIVAEIEGRLVVPRAPDMIGRWYQQGDVLGHVVPDAATQLVAAAPEHLAELISVRAVSAKARMPNGRVVDARISRVAPAARRELPNAALASTGGGSVQVDPTAQTLRALDPVIMLDLDIDPVVMHAFGARVGTKLDLGDEPVARRLARAVRRIFLRFMGDA